MSTLGIFNFKRLQEQQGQKKTESKLHPERLKPAIRKKIFTEKSSQALEQAGLESGGITTPEST